MQRSVTERNLVILLFILVLVVFSFAERDSKKLDNLYGTESSAPSLTASASVNPVSENAD